MVLLRRGIRQDLTLRVTHIELHGTKEVHSGRRAFRDLDGGMNEAICVRDRGLCAQWQSTAETSGERSPACDRREQADQVDKDAPLTTLCLVSTLLFLIFFVSGFGRRRIVTAWRAA
jgi:hypothetical protein